MWEGGRGGGGARDEEGEDDLMIFILHGGFESKPFPLTS